MKQKLLNSFKLRVCLLVAVLCAGFTGQAWGDVTDVLTASELAATSNSYTDFSNVIITSDAVYAGQSAKTSSGGIQLRSKNSNSGIVTTTSGGKVKSVTIAVESGSNTIDVYGKNSAYSSASDLYSSSTQGTKLGSLSADGTVTVTGDYEYVGIRSNNGAVYLSSVEITWETTGGSSSAVATTTTIDDSGITNTDVYEGTTAGSLSASVTAGGNAVAGATVTWSGNNDNVATINESTGAVTLVAAGTVTFTASYEGVENSYNASSATYTLNVTDSTPFAGGDVTFTAGIETSETNTLTKNGVTLTGSTFSNASYYQAFKNSTFTIETSTGTITQIVFTCTGSSYKASGFGDAITANGNNGTWTGNASKVELTASGNQVRMSQIVVTVDANGAPTPTITASDVNIAHDAISGSITCTLTNEVIGGVVSATSSESWLTIGTISGTTVPLTCTANVDNTARTATVTLTYTYNTNETVTTDVTVTQAAAPVIYSTIPALFAAATGTETSVLVTFNNWVVSGVSTNGKNVFVTDNSGNGFVIYYSSDMSGTFAAGDILSGTAVSCTLKKYNGFAELLNVDANDLTISTGGTVTAANVAMADLAGVNTGALVHYDNLTCSVDNSKYYLSDGTTTLQVYNALYAFGALEAGKTYNITGVYQQYGNSTKEILPRSDADIEEYVDSRDEAEIAFSVATLTFTEGDSYTAPTFSNPNSVSVTFDTTNSSVASWSNGLVLGGSTGTATITATFDGDTNYKPATATLTVTVNVDLNFATVVVGSGVYQKITSTSELEAGKRYLIVYSVGDDAYIFNGVSNDIGAYTTGTIGNDQIDNTVAGATPVVLQNAGSGNWYIMDGDNYVAYTSSATSSNNKLYSTDTNVDGTAWTITTSDITNAWNTVRKLRFNSTSGQERFCAYNGSQHDVVLYKELPAPVTVNISDVGYSTLYYSDRALVVPAGVEAYTYTVTNNKLDISWMYDEGETIPAGTAVVLKASAGNYTFAVSSQAGDIDDDNILKGTDDAATTTGGTYYYALSLNSSNDASSVGFYWMAANGAAFTCGAHKAYLALNKTFAELASGGTQVKSFFTLADIETAIKGIEANTENGVIYNLAGQCLSKPVKGVNIINGKKVLVK